jgi:hypothetical protein
MSKGAAMDLIVNDQLRGPECPGLNFLIYARRSLAEHLCKIQMAGGAMLNRGGEYEVEILP